MHQHSSQLCECYFIVIIKYCKHKRFISTIGFVNQWEHLGRQITNIYQFILIQNILLQNLTVWLFAGRKVWDQKLKQILCERHLAAKLVTNDSSLSVVSDRSRLQLTSAFKCLRKSSPLFLNFNKQTWQTCSMTKFDEIS